MRGRILNLHARHRIRQQNAYILALQRIQHIQHIANVEANLHLRSGVGHIQNLFRFFLFRVIGGDFQLVFANVQPHAAEFLVGENRRARKSLLQNIAARFEVFIRIFRQYAAIIRETAINQLRGEDKIANVGADIVAAYLHAQRGIAAVEHPHQLNHPFTRHDHRMVRQRRFQRHRTDRQAVTIGGHRAQFAAFGFKQHAV